MMIGMVAETEAAAANVRWRGSSPPVKREMLTGSVQFVCVNTRTSRNSL